MEKYLVTIEFRYSSPPTHEYSGFFRIKKVTIGVFDEIKDACKEGNKQLEILETHFQLNPHRKIRERLNPNSIGGLLITDLGYLMTPFEFFLKVETLHFVSIEDTINNVMDCVKKYKEFKREEMER
jgi:hypothetical protein